jgi:hypothetical protein
MSSSSACNDPGPYGYANAEATGAVTLPQTAQDSATISVDTNASALAFGIRGQYLTSTANSKSDISIMFNSLGAVRAGLLEVNIDQTAWNSPINGMMGQNLAIDSYLYTCPNPCAAAGLPTSFWLPIALGADFAFNYSQEITVTSGSQSGVSSSDIATQIVMLAFEADGKTPVQLFDPPGPVTHALVVPEPATVAFVVAGVLLLLAARNRAPHPAGLHLRFSAQGRAVKIKAGEED